MTSDSMAVTGALRAGGGGCRLTAEHGFAIRRVAVTLGNAPYGSCGPVLLPAGRSLAPRLSDDVGHAALSSAASARPELPAVAIVTP